MKITPSSLRRVEYIIDNSGIVKTLADGLRTDNRGRPQNTFAIHMLILGTFLCVAHSGNGTITEAHRSLIELGLDDRLRLGISVKDPDSPDGTSLAITLNQMYYVSKQINERLAYTKASAPDISDTERQRRHGVVQQFNQSAMDVFDLDWDANWGALDATGVWSWGRGKARPKGEPSTERALRWLQLAGLRCCRLRSMSPSFSTWDVGDRLITCLIVAADGSDLTESARAS